MELKTAAVSGPTSQLPLHVYFPTFISAIQIFPPFAVGLKETPLALNLAGPAVCILQILTW